MMSIGEIFRTQIENAEGKRGVRTREELVRDLASDGVRQGHETRKADLLILEAILDVRDIFSSRDSVVGISEESLEEKILRRLTRIQDSVDALTSGAENMNARLEQLERASKIEANLRSLSTKKRTAKKVGKTKMPTARKR